MDWTPIIVAIIAFAGTITGTAYGISKANSLTLYRIGQLEVKMDKHNCLIERTYKLEQSATLFCEQIKVANHRIEDLEAKE